MLQRLSVPILCAILPALCWEEGLRGEEASLPPGLSLRRDERVLGAELTAAHKAVGI
jgi:hypothetical protein